MDSKPYENTDSTHRVSDVPDESIPDLLAEVEQHQLTNSKLESQNNKTSEPPDESVPELESILEERKK